MVLQHASWASFEVPRAPCIHAGSGWNQTLGLYACREAQLLPGNGVSSFKACWPAALELAFSSP